jgi:hypothetical protein
VSMLGREARKLRDKCEAFTLELRGKVFRRLRRFSCGIESKGS